MTQQSIQLATAPARTPAGPPSKQRLVADVNEILSEIKRSVSDLSKGSRHVRAAISGQINSDVLTRLPSDFSSSYDSAPAIAHAAKMHDCACDLRNQLEYLMAKLSGLT